MLNLIPGGLIGKGIALLIVLAVVSGTYAYWRHSLIVQGQRQALEAVKAQNATAKRAAEKVALTVDQCFEREGWTWSVITGACEEIVPEPVE